MSFSLVQNRHRAAIQDMSDHHRMIEMTVTEHVNR